MKKVLVISDSFKGTLSSTKIARLAEACIHRHLPECQVIGLPVADGGEGTVDCFLEAMGGKRIMVSVCGPWRETLEAGYARIGDTAIVEMAAAAGLPLVQGRKDPSETTTWGVGMMIRHAVDQGARHIILGLGGSATNDGGCGCAAALGVRFYDEQGKVFCPVGKTLHRISRIEPEDACKFLQDVAIEVMCDIDNPLCGPRGAASIFGPQKGADGSMIRMLDAGLHHMAQVIRQDCHVDVETIPGAGAAGGFGAGAVAFLRACLRPGIEVALDMVSFEEQLAGCDLVITGEGRIDGQSISGKVPVGVARRAKKLGVPVVAIVGILGDGVEAVYQEGITAVFNTNRKALPFEEVRKTSEEDYCSTLEDILRLYCSLSPGL